MRFPYDWLKPGDIKYCSCGFHLLVPGHLVCHECDKDMMLQERNKIAKLSAQLWQDALALAKKRQDEGLPRLFWMQEKT